MGKYDKEKILKAARQTNKKTVTHKGNTIKPSVNFSAETFQARKECHVICKVLNGKNMQPKILFPAGLSFTIEEEIKSFPNKN